jgi:hypothetical protein
MPQVLRRLFDHGLGLVLYPLLILATWHSEGGRQWAMLVFFLACATRVAREFQRLGRRLAIGDPATLSTWGTSLQSLAATVLSAWLAFSVLSLPLNNPRDFDVVILAFVLAITALCVTPYLMLLTKKVFASVVFTVFAAFATKLLGCVVVVLVYGWDASERGHTTMPFTHPNLLVGMIWLNTAVLSTWCCFQARRRFQAVEREIRSLQANV